MGCSGSSKVEPITPQTEAEIKKEAEAGKKSKVIDGQLAIAKEKDESFLKLLLLGAGESGKSTIFKQMKQIYSKSYDDIASRLPFVRIIHHNIVQAMKTLVEQTAVLQIAIDASAGEAAKYVNEQVRVDDPPTALTFTHIKTLWRDAGIRACYEQRAKFQLIDTCNRLFETSFEEKGNKFLLLDVGGQKNERKKWIHSFEGVTAVIFVVGLSEYDQLMFEDLSTNRMHDALSLFDEICNLKWFNNTAMLLFLNKRDLFQDKIRNVDLNMCFPEYTGGCNYEAALRFLVEKFTGKNQSTAKKVYFHVTCATDMSNISFTFNACKSIIVEHGLRHAGLVA